MSLYPALFICHGGGPLPILGDPGHEELVIVLKKHRQELESHFGLPKVIAVVSAHYQTSTPHVGAADKPELLYDYYNFPPPSYEFRYPSPGDSSLTREMVDALNSQGISATADATRPLDHGVFIPLMLMFPEAEIPVIPVSVLDGDDPTAHIKMGEALSPFRSKGVFFLGSGSSMHSFPVPYQGAGGKFGNSLTSLLCDAKISSERRIEAMRNVINLDGFDEAQPPGAHEHLMPLLTILGTANGTEAEELASLSFGKANVRHYLFRH